MIGTKLAHYEVTSHLGSGGMGDVYHEKGFDPGDWDALAAPRGVGRARQRVGPPDR